jgi:hypothetical protein
VGFVAFASEIGFRLPYSALSCFTDEASVAESERLFDSGDTMHGQREELDQQALLAFQRDLSLLWKERPGQWVAYRGDQQLGFAAQKHELYQRLFQRGLEREEFVVFCIEAQETEMVIGPDMQD